MEQISENDLRAQVWIQLSNMHLEMTNLWILTGIQCGALDPEATEKMMLEVLAQLPEDVQAYWGAPCHLCVTGVEHAHN